MKEFWHLQKPADKTSTIKAELKRVQDEEMALTSCALTEWRAKVCSPEEWYARSIVLHSHLEMDFDDKSEIPLFKGKNSLELELDLLCLVLSKYIFNVLIGSSRWEEESEGRAGMKIGSLLGIWFLPRKQGSVKRATADWSRLNRRQESETDCMNFTSSSTRN
jgi:hypothetical protein